MPNYKNVEPITSFTPSKPKPKKNWYAGLVAGASYGLVSASHAAGLDEIGEVIKAQFASAESIVIALLMAAATITAIIIGYKKLSSGAKSA